jgi:hypothetical protein
MLSPCEQWHKLRSLGTSDGCPPVFITTWSIIFFIVSPSVGKTINNHKVHKYSLQNTVYNFYQVLSCENLSVRWRPGLKCTLNIWSCLMACVKKIAITWSWSCVALYATKWALKARVCFCSMINLVSGYQKLLISIPKVLGPFMWPSKPSRSNEKVQKSSKRRNFGIPWHTGELKTR